MADTKELMYAKEAFNTLCTTLNNIGWTYDKNEESLKIDFWVKTDDLPMRFLMIVDADKQLVRIYSPLPFKANPDKRVELITAITIINYSLADGTFMCELDDGSIIFKSERTLEFGSFVMVKITDAKDYDCYGEAVQ